MLILIWLLWLTKIKTLVDLDAFLALIWSHATIPIYLIDALDEILETCIKL